MRIAAMRGFLERPVRATCDPLRVVPERRLPADWSLPGHCPAQEARCPAVGNTLMSVPISAIIVSAVRCCDAGDRAQQLHRLRERARAGPRSLPRAASICSSRKSRWARIAPTSSAWSGVEAALQRLASAGILVRSLPLARSASTSGSVVPATSASSIARPETPRMSVATQSSLIPVSSSALCSRLASR